MLLVLPLRGSVLARVAMMHNSTVLCYMSAVTGVYYYLKGIQSVEP